MAVATTACATGRYTISIFGITCWGIPGSCFGGLFVCFYLKHFEKCVHLSVNHSLYVFLTVLIKNAS